MCAVHFCIVFGAAWGLYFLAQHQQFPTTWRWLLPLFDRWTPHFFDPVVRLLQQLQSPLFDTTAIAFTAVVWGQTNIVTATIIARRFGQNSNVRLAAMGVPTITSLVCFWGVGGTLTLTYLITHTLPCFAATWLGVQATKPALRFARTRRAWWIVRRCTIAALLVAMQPVKGLAVWFRQLGH